MGMIINFNLNDVYPWVSTTSGERRKEGGHLRGTVYVTGIPPILLLQNKSLLTFFSLLMWLFQLVGWNYW